MVLLLDQAQPARQRRLRETSGLVGEQVSILCNFDLCLIYAGVGISRLIKDLIVDQLGGEGSTAHHHKALLPAR